MATPTDRPRIFSHLTRTRFLHIEDSLERAKLRFFIGSFAKGQGASETAYAFLDVDDARVLMNDLAWGKPVNFVDHKGGIDGNNVAQARVLKIRTSEDLSAARQVWIQLQNGSGALLGEGAVKMQGQPTVEISIPLTVFEARKMGFACLAYLDAWQVSQFMKSLSS